MPQSRQNSWVSGGGKAMAISTDDTLQAASEMTAK
jgi:hypothetical protein